MNFKPFSAYVLVKQISGEATTASGIVIPVKGEENVIKAEVIAIGPGALNGVGTPIPMQTKVGQIVYFWKDNGAPISIDGVPHKLVRDHEIFGTVEN